MTLVWRRSASVQDLKELLYLRMVLNHSKKHVVEKCLSIPPVPPPPIGIWHLTKNIKGRLLIDFLESN